MSSITVAIWMVTYNHEDYIEQAIRSVMQQQTTFNLKLFIGEDCSTDKTKSICEQLQAEFPDKIELILNQENLGSTQNARNTYARCFQYQPNYIALLEGDDYWADTLKLQQQVDFLEANKAYTFSMTRFLALRPDKSLKDENDRFFKDDLDVIYNFEMFTKGWYGGTLTLMFRTAAIDVEIFNRYNYFRDVHLYTELLKKGLGICQNFISAVYRVHDKGQHNSLSKLQQAKTAVNCYQELYMQNLKVDALKIKYTYFAQNYIEELIKNRSYLKVVLKTFTFGFKLKDSTFVTKMLKKIMKSNIIVLKLKSFFRKKKKIKEFEGSEYYWEKRYQSDKNSGSGSYGRLADFKAEVLNQFVEENNIKTVIELGCGDGNQLSLANYPYYIGFDVSEKALEICKAKFRDDDTKTFYNSFDDKHKGLKADLTMSLDVIYHLIEDTVFESYMQQLFMASTNYVIVFSSNYNKRSAAHVRSRKFTDWIDKNKSEEWKLVDVIKNKYPFQESDPNNTSMADFYIYKII
ncbi:glycosyltransferase [Winogradskyella immobilis]|uniref:Glycosyltransferase n=1 Tax=Winogradskyella immobilis TaxID=2816852 RepID=A0ABS8EP28_9FLAO|nr:glycosyltransferase [Winogradskyella immobilis]MCC1484903.1 glycosyltransferase [Winogradskyella immobilis]MCG0016995.1 glycosyltransferase [Winogradskyella immobilis]